MNEDKLRNALEWFEAQNKIEDNALFVAGQFERKTPTSEIVNKLVDRGLSQAEAEQFVQDAKKAFLRQSKKSGNKDLKVGFAFFVAGIVITGLGAWVASQVGGIYIVTIGAIITGIALIIRGVKKRFRRL